MKDSSLVYDILKEVFNIGVGKAADMLSQIIDRKVILNVPNIRIIELDDEDIELDKYFAKDIKGTLMISSIKFEEDVTGEANLIFPADKMRTVINFCTKEDSDEEDDLNFTDIDLDIVKELGNIILNSIIGEMGNLLNVNLEYTLPNVKLFNSKDFVYNVVKKDNIQLLMLCISFILEDTEIEGAVIISLTLSSLNQLIKIIEKMEADLYE